MSEDRNPYNPHTPNFNDGGPDEVTILRSKLAQAASECERLRATNVTQMNLHEAFTRCQNERDELKAKLATANAEAAQIINATLAELEKVREQFAAWRETHYALQAELSALKAAQPRMVKLPERYASGLGDEYEVYKSGDLRAALDNAGVAHE